MPCIIITGYPASGKSAVAERIRERALQLQLADQVVIVSEHSAVGQSEGDKSESRDEIFNIGVTAYYRDTLTEKKTRGALKAAFDRAVSKATDKTLVILDALNYIKGVRYELHCISKAANQKHAVVWIVNDSTTTTAQGPLHQEKITQELISRYEPPDARNRWDSPLYVVDMRENDTSMKQVMEQTVYNMHQLSDVLQGVPKQPTENTPQVAETAQIQSDIPLVVGGGGGPSLENSQVDAPKPKASKPTVTSTKSGFKRAGFKRHATINTAPLPETQTSSSDTTSSNSSAPQSKNSETQKDDTVAKKPLEERIDQLLQEFLGDRVKPLQQGTSTVQHVASETDLLNRIDSLTQQVCRSIMTAQQLQAATKPYSIIVNAVPYSFHGPAGEKQFTVNELRQLRKQYLHWIAAHPPTSARGDAALIQSFLDFLQTQQQQQVSVA